MNFVSRCVAVGGIALLAACAHPIDIAPNLAAFDGAAGQQKISKSVGYYISAEDRAREVTTPGGGGDKITYFPYRDLEPGLFKVLSQNFSNVYVLKSADDKAFMASKGIAYVILPKIQTTSSSDSVLTWPPTDFSVSLECRALSSDGTVIWETTARGQGKATFSEFKSDLALAGRRASEGALLEFERQLRTSPLGR